MTIDNLTPPTCDQRPGEGRIRTRHQDMVVENNQRSAGAEGHCERIEENINLLDARLAAVEAHLQALHVARTKGGI